MGKEESVSLKEGRRGEERGWGKREEENERRERR